MTNRVARATIVALALASCTLAYAAPADAAVYTSNGVRCTKVGTSGADTISGTAYRDVICGLGGNDVLRGLGGNDLIDGGSGNDSIDGGSGNDVVIGGGGSDGVGGNTGYDKVYGGDGNDRVYGGDQDDYVSAGNGNDYASGGSGADTLNAGPNDDTLNGGSGNDDLWGSYGNDDLDGGSGADDVSGGPGTNWCTVDSTDTTRTQCVYDLQPAAAIGYTLSRSTVDVTSSTQQVEVYVHVTDDTGVRSVQFGAADVQNGGGFGLGTPRLSSGTVRNGWWHSTAYIQRWSVPGTFALDVFTTDRVGRSGYQQFAYALAIVDRAPDTTMPQVASIGLTSSTGSFPVDVRTTTRSVTVKAHLTDDVSGIYSADACLYYPSSGGYLQAGGCPVMSRYSGTEKDGWYRATISIPAKSVGGDWNVVIYLTDRAHSGTNDFWIGPDVYRAWQDDCGGCVDPRNRALPPGQGRFGVRGVSDSTPPTLMTVTATPTSADTLPGPATVSVDVRATDASGEGVTSVGVFPFAIDSDGSAPSLGMYESTAPTSGTRTDGWWHFEVTLPQGTPPGSFGLQVAVQDAGHWRSWMTQTSAELPPDQAPLSPAQLGSWDGRIVVVPHAG